MAKIDKITYMNNNTEYELEWFTPENAWVTDDVLTKTASGYEWQAPTTPTVVSGDSWTTYTIKVANSDPAPWTAATTITFVV